MDVLLPEFSSKSTRSPSLTCVEYTNVKTVTGIMHEHKLRCVLKNSSPRFSKTLCSSKATSGHPRTDTGDTIFSIEMGHSRAFRTVSMSSLPESLLTYIY